MSGKQNGLCRCCQAEGQYISLSDTCSEHNETYTNIIKNTLDLTLSPISGPLSQTTYLICEECISKLKMTISFKEQVLRSERMFQEMCQNNKLPESLTITIKEEDSDTDCEFANSPDVDCNSTDNKTEETNKIKVKKKNNSKRTDRHKNNEAKSEFTEGKDYTYDSGLYTCLHCNKSETKTKAGLLYHIKSVHFNIHKFKCVLCEQSFKAKTGYIKHLLDIHNKDERVVCNACNKYFYTNRNLSIHIDTFHKLGKMYCCDVCDFTTYRGSNLNKHKYSHTTAKNFLCKYCSKGFKRNSSLKLHERIHTNDRRKVCEECGQAFVQKASLNYHMTKYHPEVQF